MNLKFPISLGQAVISYKEEALIIKRYINVGKIKKIDNYVTLWGLRRDR